MSLRAPDRRAIVNRLRGNLVRDVRGRLPDSSDPLVYAGSAARRFRSVATAHQQTDRRRGQREDLGEFVRVPTPARQPPDHRAALVRQGR